MINHVYLDVQISACDWIDPEVQPQTEEYWGHVNPNGQRACHDEGKRISETLSYAYEKQVFTVLNFVIKCDNNTSICKAHNVSIRAESDKVVLKY